MKKTQEEILSELKAQISVLRDMLDSMEDKIARLNVVEAAEDVPEVIMAAPVKEAVAVAPAVAEVVAEAAPAVAETLEEPAPVVAEVVAEPAPAEAEVAEAEVEELPQEAPQVYVPNPDVEDIVHLVAEPETADGYPEAGLNLNERYMASRKKSLGETMEQNEAWRTALPGAPVTDVMNAIPLNDRILFLNELFASDSDLFQSVVSYINQAPDFDSAVSMLYSQFPQWDMNSDTVYRFMMAVRRKTELR